MKTGRVLLKIYVFRWIFFSLFAVNLTEGRVSRLYSIAKSRIFSSSSRPTPGPVKEYTGVRVSHESILLLNYHEQTVAVVEYGLNGTLLNCELLEVRTEEDQRAAIDTLSPYVDKVTEMSFDNMIDLMSLCHQLDPPFGSGKELMDEGDNSRTDSRHITSIFSGVFPGTKWCGSGDLASSYYDLGPDWKVDKCCRTHDHCPVKIPGFKSQYGLTNYAFYTSSHCTCDKFFFACLKYLDTTTSNLLGGIFFNVNPSYYCVEDVFSENHMSKPTKKFQKLNMRF